MADRPSTEGWYKDPFGAHEARWFSDGSPTALVRDGDAEAHDPPPEGSAVEASHPEELEPAGEANDGTDLRRAGEPEELSVLDAVLDVEGRMSPLD